MTKLEDLMDLEFLTAEVAAGNVRSRTHPDNENLVILNYTEQAQYSKHWNSVTTQCRGLIVDRVSGNVLARPFEKFFNVGEYDPVHNWREELGHPFARVRTVDKLDGSLGILYMAPDGLPAVATRGSFMSDQAQHATALLRERYPEFWAMPWFTPLFEIVYPENRIVLDYGDQDDLIFLGLRNIETGLAYGPDALRTGYGEEIWYGPRAEILPPTTFAEALEFGDRTNREGLVVTFEASGLMVKIKQEDYVRLHRLVTGLNERVIWEHLAGGMDEGLGDLIEKIPDEFHAWVERVADGLFTQFEILHGRAHHAYHGLLSWLEDEHGAGGWERKHFATEARLQHGDLTPLLFQLLDGRDISASIWKTLKPKGQTQSLMNRTEDVS